MGKKTTSFENLFGGEVNTSISSGAFSAETIVQNTVKEASRRVGRVPLDKMRPNPNQPRKVFDPVKLRQLGESIQEHGLLQPLVIREAADESGMFDIAAGERRWQAMQLVDMTAADAIILDARCTDEEMEEIALVENVQREDLSPIELAQGYMKLHRGQDGKVKRTIAGVAKIVKKSESVIDDYLAILRAPERVRQLIIDDPRIAVRTIRELSQIKEEADLDYLLDEVRTGYLKANDISRIRSSVKLPKSQQRKMTAFSQDAGKSESSHSSTQSKSGDEQQREIPSNSAASPESTTSTRLAQKKRPSPAVALAALEQQARHYEITFQKIFSKLNEDVPFMTLEEKQVVRNLMRTCLERSEQVLRLALVDAEL